MPARSRAPGHVLSGSFGKAFPHSLQKVCCCSSQVCDQTLNSQVHTHTHTHTHKHSLRFDCVHLSDQGLTIWFMVGTDENLEIAKEKKEERKEEEAKV